MTEGHYKLLSLLQAIQLAGWLLTGWYSLLLLSLYNWFHLVNLIYFGSLPKCKLLSYYYTVWSETYITFLLFFVFNIVTFIKRGRIIFLQLLKLHAALVSIASIGPIFERNALSMPFPSFVESSFQRRFHLQEEVITYLLVWCHFTIYKECLIQGHGDCFWPVLQYILPKLFSSHNIETPIKYNIIIFKCADICY